MKRVLITGANSYVGTNVEKWLMKEPYKYYVETLDMKDPNWKAFDFSKFDVVFHVAGIAHVSAKKKMKDLYFKVNRDLVIDSAKKAKVSGVKQFIFMSSMIVYNSKETKISNRTIPSPSNFYGESKLLAEKGILKLQDEKFKICILRPPMIYGPYSKGNFSRLINLTKKIMIFPKYENQRSMLYIDNLSNTVMGLIEINASGIFFPQNNEYICTYKIIEEIARLRKRKVIYIKIFNPVIKILLNKINPLNKMFSDSIYETYLSEPTKDFNVVDFYSSLYNIVESENS